MHKLSRAEARRIAVRAQLLDAARPDHLLDMVHGLTQVQADPTAAVAPSAHLVAWCRLGSAYSPADLTAALADRTLIELRGMIRPAEDIALYRAEMAAWPGTGKLTRWQENLRDWVRANDGCRRDILARLDADGPLSTRELPDTCTVPWRSSGWNDNRNLDRLLDLMVQRGEVALAGRRRGDRIWDLAERVYLDDPVVPLEEALRRRDERELASMGLVRGRSTQVEPFAGEPAEVDGVRGRWRVDPAQLDQPFAGRVALLSPLDRLVYDRKRMTDLFEFDYQLEMYKPVGKRRWGYWALPILAGDRLVGKVDATADRKAGVLRVNAIHEDVAFDEAAVGTEIAELADWLGLDPVGSIAA
ncbi:winged helix DNA-binding domain-containing protein [Actinoplanes sp. KI2]|uniref:DNA glycosylase AlkZ-like family protein n=1 Tax=Actinoplanes sp. KI2 TaxID=2983315 RepID=UPI0021D59BA3|nr:crosslink repair DNA glycosylase YcaQ family protein [Actinoplanes sp. KI2]MCU7722819.1 winged helix DNA-binding domain-containing protein [Actinoplanes sp. KI2]